MAPYPQACIKLEAIDADGTPDSCAPALLVAGLMLAALILKSLSALRSVYGQLLIVKLVGFALLMGLAALNKRYSVLTSFYSPD
jgi:hypothetical protein